MSETNVVTVRSKDGNPTGASGEVTLPVRNEPSFTEQMQLAETLLRTGFLPKSLTTPGQVLAVILTGREMGLGPMQSTRSIGIINGRPVVAADLQLALFHKAGGQSKWTILTEQEAKLWLKHPNGVEHTESFTMEDAKRAKLTDRGDTYQKYPKAMLRSRAITAGLKSVGFEATTGVYDPEELGIPAGTPPPAEQPLSERPQQLTEEPAPWEPGEKLWPVGDHKGTPLKDLTSDQLTAGLQWIKKTGRYSELLEPVGEVLAARQGE